MSNANKPTRIALLGRAGSGKDTLAGYAILYYDFRALAFADELKRHAYALFGGYDREKPRALLQRFGGMCREIDDEVWVRALMRNVELERDKPIVVTDCRHWNEYEALKNAGFTFVRVEAPESQRIQRMTDRGDQFDKAALEHETERNIDEMAAQYTIDNSGGLRELERQWDGLMREVIDA